MLLAATSRLNSFVQFLTLIIVFVIVLAITYFTTRYIGNYQKVNSKYVNFEIVETFRVSNTKFIQILKIGKKYVALAICKDSITKIVELDEAEITIPDYSDNQITFAKLLEKFQKVKHNEDEDRNKDDEENQ